MSNPQTLNPSEVVDILLNETLKNVPNCSEAEILEAHKAMQRAWKSQQLFFGNPSEIRALILENLNELATDAKFENFKILTLDKDRCAQIMTFFSTGTFIGVRVWQTENAIYVCGNSAFHGVSTT